MYTGEVVPETTQPSDTSTPWRLTPPTVKPVLGSRRFATRRHMPSCPCTSTLMWPVPLQTPSEVLTKLQPTGVEATTTGSPLAAGVRSQSTAPSEATYSATEPYLSDLWVVVGDGTGAT